MSCGPSWIPPGATIEVAGHEIADGMIYVGRGLVAASGYETEPALIDPSLKVDARRTDHTGMGLDYWPRYDKLPPESRASYLAWLAKGRSDPATPIGYVFLFFYGLERRVLVDLGLEAAHPEIAEVAQEVRRLRTIYGAQRSFDSYSRSLLDLIEGAESLHASVSSPEPPTLERGWEVPLVVRVALGRYCAAGRPIPPNWALALLRTHPEAQLRTPATRCAAEFDDLFRHLYSERFKDGMVIRAPKRRVAVRYRPASSGFHGEVALALGEVPDVTTIAGPIGKLKELAQECADALDAYSRYLGRNPDARGSSGAVGLLPDALLATHGGAVVEGLRSWSQGLLGDGAQATTTIDEVVARWDPARTQTLARADAVALAVLLAKVGFGIEPDVRFGGSAPKPGSAVVLFPLPAGATAAPSTAYAAAAVLVHLAAVVSAADGSVTESERRHLAKHLEAVLGLDDAERVRLEAHLSCLVASSKASLAGLKRRLDVLDAGRRAAVGQFLIDVAAADGQVSPDEITVLTKLYALLGLEEGDVYRLIHALAAEGSGPVPVMPAGTDAPRWQIPPPEPDTAGAVRLDHAKVQARLADTAAVAALLSDIFTDEEETQPSSVAGEFAVPADDDDGIEGGAPGARSVAGLDGAHSGLARALSARPSWSRSEVESLAGSLGLPLLDGALERINDAAIEACGEPLVEGDDPLQMNDYATQECIV